MFGTLAVRFRRAHHPDFAMEFLREQRRAEIVAPHVSGQQDRASRYAEFLEPFGADDFVGEFFVEQAVDRGLGNRPGKVVERAKGPQIIRRAPRTRQDDGEVGHDRAPRRGGEKEKEDGEERERDRIKKERQVNDSPVEILPPEDALYGEAAQPAHRGAATGADAGLDCIAVCWVASRAKMSRRFVSSARHQWPSPFQTNFPTRRSGTKPS